MILTEGLLLVLPSFVRALTFYGDSLWREVISALMAIFLPSANTLVSALAIALGFALLVALFEKWVDGDLHFLPVGPTNTTNKDVGNPNTGVLN
jgi:hypothetical protein